MKRYGSLSWWWNKPLDHYRTVSFRTWPHLQSLMFELYHHLSWWNSNSPSRWIRIRPLPEDASVKTVHHLWPLYWFVMNAFIALEKANPVEIFFTSQHDRCRKQQKISGPIPEKSNYQGLVSNDWITPGGSSRRRHLVMLLSASNY